MALRIGKRRLFSQSQSAPGAATAGLTPRIPAAVIALGFSTAIHGGLLTASYFVSWNPAPASNPKINFASGDQAARFQVRLAPWPDPTDVDELKSETREDTRTAESLASMVHVEATANHDPVSVTSVAASDANMPSPSDTKTLAMSDADSLPAIDASTRREAMVEPLENALESEPVWVIEEVRGFPPVNDSARKVDDNQPVEVAFSELFRQLEQLLAEPAPHEDATAHQPTTQPHPAQNKPKPQASDHQAPLARKGVHPDTKHDAASRNVPAATSTEAANVPPPPGKIAQPDSSASRRIGVETGVETLHLPAPKYPSLSRREGEEGLVLLEVEVLPDGTVGTIKLLRSAGFRRLNKAAIAAARKGRFKPATRDGHPIRATVRIPFRFVLRRSDLWYDQPQSLAQADTSDIGFAL